MTFQPGSAREIPDPEAEVARLALERQVSAGQVCTVADRACDPDCEVAPHCAGHHQVRWKRAHDADACDRAWAATEAGQHG